MAPRQRSTSPPSMVETTDMQQESQPLVSSSSSTSSLNGTSLKRAKHSAENSVELPYQQLAEIARERHDFFNIFALVCCRPRNSRDVVWSAFSRPHHELLQLSASLRYLLSEQL
jgi:hypothetical protein